MDLGPDDAAGRQATAIATDNAAKDLLGGTQVGGDKEALETIIVTAQRKAIDNDCQQHGPHAVFYPGQNPSVVVSSGWQVPRDHGAESGYEVKIDENDHREWRFAHMDPATAIAQGANVNPGDYIGDYADPTNGNSTGPHVHEGLVVNGRHVDPGNVPPVVHGTTPPGGHWGDISAHHPVPHNGRDWRADPNQEHN